MPIKPVSGEIDSQEINDNFSYLDSKTNNISKGNVSGSYATIALLTAAFPSGNTNLYVVQETGNWHYWNGSSWAIGGRFQETGIADGSVTSELTDFVKKTVVSKNYFNKEKAIDGFYVSYLDGLLKANTNYVATEFIDIPYWAIRVGRNSAEQFAIYDSANNRIDGYAVYGFRALPPNAAKVRFSVKKDSLDTFQVAFLTEGELDTFPTYDDYKAVYSFNNPGGGTGQKLLYVVDQQNNGDFATISEAVGFINNTELDGLVTIQVNPGEYEEVVINKNNQKSNLQFVDRENTFLIDKTGRYSNSPLATSGNGKYKNLNIIANHDNNPSVVAPFSYAAHLDYAGAGEQIFDNCKFKSFQNSSVGIGTHQDQTLIFSNCEIFNSAQNYDNGAFYVHNAVATGTQNQKLVLINCMIISEFGLAFRLDDACEMAGNSDSILELEVINCYIWSDTMNENGLQIRGTGTGT